MTNNRLSKLPIEELIKEVNRADPKGDYSKEEITSYLNKLQTEENSIMISNDVIYLTV